MLALRVQFFDTMLVVSIVSKHVDFTVVHHGNRVDNAAAHLLDVELLFLLVGHAIRFGLQLLFFTPVARAKRQTRLDEVFMRFEAHHVSILAVSDRECDAGVTVTAQQTFTVVAPGVTTTRLRDRKCMVKASTNLYNLCSIFPRTFSTKASGN